MTYTWARGRCLSSIVGQSGETVSFSYDASGLRTAKTKGGVRTAYVYEDNRLLREKTASSAIDYLYGTEGIIGFKSGGAVYLYGKNLQGDVTKIYNEAGAIVAKYSYTAYGECTIEQDTNGIATLNPIRYRSYYYDSETGLYYLQSRYYDPETGRFINADDLSYLDPERINGLNLYAYCENDPVMNHDPTGCFALSIFLISIGLGALIGGAIGCGFELGAQLIAGNGLDWGKIGLATLGGAVAGAITAIPIPGFQALGPLGKVFSYGLSFLAGAAGTLASGAITGSIDFTNGWSIAAGVLIGGFANVAARGVSDFILGKSVFKIINQGNKAKSLAIQKLQGHRLNMGLSALKGGMRNVFKVVTKSQVMQLLNNSNPLFRYGIYSTLNGAFLSGFPYMFNW